MIIINIHCLFIGFSSISALQISNFTSPEQFNTEDILGVAMMYVGAGHLLQFNRKEQLVEAVIRASFQYLKEPYHQ